MVTYVRLLNELTHDGAHWSITIPDDWGQGRTAFGGIIAALMYESVIREFDTLGPLRTTHFNFVAPASGPLHISNQIIRQGKNVTTIESQLRSEKGIACVALMSFGHALASTTRQNYASFCPEVRPEDVQLLAAPPHQPLFLQHFDRRPIHAPDYLSGAEHPEFLVWVRFNDVEAQALFSGILAIADAPPPPALSAVRSLSALSTINWTLNFLDDSPQTRDGWWLMQTKTDHVVDGYSSQIMTIWNADGQRIIDGIQHVAVFE